MTKNIDNQQLYNIAQNVITQEADALHNLSNHLDKNLLPVFDILLNTTGKIIVMGMGKSGHIARKIAATFASTGTPAFFIHPSEALHGDMGMIADNDTVIMLSFSGENDELIATFPYLEQHKIPSISITGNAESTLAVKCTYPITIAIQQEACPLGLAPTTSTTAMLALGDALAIALLNARGFTEYDFARTHPNGRLGKQLLLRAENIAHFGDELPTISTTATIAEALVNISEKRLGLTIILDENYQLAGIYTDGDIRRTIEKKYDVLTTPIAEVMHQNPIIIPAECPISEALLLMNEKRITALIVKKTNGELGILHMHDIIQTRAF